MVLPEPRSWDCAVELESQSEGLSVESWHQGGDSVAVMSLEAERRTVVIFCLTP